MPNEMSFFEYNNVTYEIEDEKARQDLAECVNNGYYDSNAKKIILRHDSDIIVQIDATDFIKDGMVSNVQIINGYLVITFNTDSGQEPISIPITDIFNPDNYYNKSATNALLLLKQDVIQDLAQIRQGAEAGATAYQKPQGGIPLSDINSNDIDAAPTQNSNKLVKSGGVQNELALGAVYDVSAHNNSATFASLQALLSNANIDTLIPTSVRKGGMSIKFVQSSDNNYVKFFCTAQNFTTDVAYWQGVEDVKEQFAGSIGLTHNIKQWKDGYINSEGEVIIAAYAYMSYFIPITKGYRVSVNSPVSAALNAISFFRKENGNYVFVEGISGTGSDSMKPYSYKANEDGYIVFSISNRTVSTAKEDTSYIINFDLSNITEEIALGSVYDVTAHNGGATFDSLTALLGAVNIDSLIPTSIRKGGMSIKFAQSNNRYIQYKYVSNNISSASFTNAANWELEITKETLSEDFLGLISEIKNLPLKDYSLLENGKFGTNDDYKHAAIAVNEGEIYYLIGISNLVKVAFATSNTESSGGDIPLVSGTSVISMPQNKQYYKFVVPTGCSYMLFNASGIFGTRCYKLNDSLQPLEGLINGEEQIFNSVKGDISTRRIININLNAGDIITLKVDKNTSGQRIDIYEENYESEHVVHLNSGSLEYIVMSNITKFVCYCGGGNSTYAVSAIKQIEGIEERLSDVESVTPSSVGINHNIKNWKGGYINSSGEVVLYQKIFRSNYIPICKGYEVTVNSAASSSINAISFFRKQGNNYIFVEGVLGSGSNSLKQYSYKANEDGYLVFSVSEGSISTAREDTTYIINYCLEDIVNNIYDAEDNSSRKNFQKIENYIEPWKAVLIGSSAKYFSTSNLKLVVDAMADAGLNKLICQIFSDRGFRWSLNTDDSEPSEMVFTIDGITYDLTTALGDGMDGGDGSDMWVTRAEMDDFLDYCNSNHVDFIPCFSMPSHMGAILKEFPSLAYNSTYNNILNIRSQHCCDVAHAILDIFVKYFGSKNVNRVIIGGDEMRGVFSGNEELYFRFQNESMAIVHYYDMIPVIWNDYLVYTGKNGLLQNKNTEVIHWNSTVRSDNTPEFAIDLGYNVINANMHKLYWILGYTPSMTPESLRTFNHFEFDNEHIIQDNYRKYCLGSMLCFWCDVADAHGPDGGDAMIPMITPLIEAFGEGIAQYEASNILNVECTNTAMSIESGKIGYIDVPVSKSVKIKKLISGTIDSNNQLQVHNITNVSANVVGGYVSNGNIRLWFTNISNSTISISSNISVQLRYL